LEDLTELGVTVEDLLSWTKSESSCIMYRILVHFWCLRMVMHEFVFVNCILCQNIEACKNTFARI